MPGPFRLENDLTMRQALLLCSLVAACSLAGCSAGRESHDTRSAPLPAAGERQGSGSAPGAVTLEDTRWGLLELNGERMTFAEDKLEPYFILDSGTKRLEGFGGCNRMGGAYNATGDSLRFGPLISTQMACPDAEMKLEQGFFQALGAVTTWMIEGEHLSLYGGEKILAKLTPR